MSDKTSSNEFIEMVNHELKSPLTTIKLFIETLEKRLETSSKKDLQNNIKNIDQKIDYLTTLINDYTDIVRIQSNNFNFHPKKVLLSTVLDKCFRRLKDNYNNIVIKLPKHSTKKIYVDEDGLYQVFKSLVMYLIKVSGNTEKIIIELKIFPNHIVFNFRPIDYQYPHQIGLEFLDPETLTGNQFKVLNIKENQRISSSLASEIIKYHHGKLILCSDNNSRIACCFSLPSSK